MSKHFNSLQNGQRVEVYLKDGRIREGTFCEWVPVEGMNFLIVDEDEYIKDGKHFSNSWFMSESSIKLIYPL